MSVIEIKSIRILRGFTALSDVNDVTMSFTETLPVRIIATAPKKGTIQNTGTVAFFIVTEGLRNATTISKTQVTAAIISTVVICLLRLFNLFANEQIITPETIKIQY
jgi:hypothetical protein